MLPITTGERTKPLLEDLFMEPVWVFYVERGANDLITRIIGKSYDRIDELPATALDTIKRGEAMGLTTSKFQTVELPRRVTQ